MDDNNPLLAQLAIYSRFVELQQNQTDLEAQAVL